MEAEADAAEATAAVNSRAANYFYPYGAGALPSPPPSPQQRATGENGDVRHRRGFAKSAGGRTTTGADSYYFCEDEDDYVGSDEERGGPATAAAQQPPNLREHSLAAVRMLLSAGADVSGREWCRSRFRHAIFSLGCFVPPSSYSSSSSSSHSSSGDDEGSSSLDQKESSASSISARNGERASSSSSSAAKASAANASDNADTAVSTPRVASSSSSSSSEASAASDDDAMQRGYEEDVDSDTAAAVVVAADPTCTAALQGNAPSSPSSAQSPAAGASPTSPQPPSRLCRRKRGDTLARRGVVHIGDVGGGGVGVDFDFASIAAFAVSPPSHPEVGVLGCDAGLVAAVPNTTNGDGPPLLLLPTDPHQDHQQQQGGGEWRRDFGHGGASPPLSHDSGIIAPILSSRPPPAAARLSLNTLGLGGGTSAAPISIAFDSHSSFNVNVSASTAVSAIFGGLGRNYGGFLSAEGEETCGEDGGLVGIGVGSLGRGAGGMGLGFEGKGGGGGHWQRKAAASYALCTSSSDCVGALLRGGGNYQPSSVAAAAATTFAAAGGAIPTLGVSAAECKSTLDGSPLKRRGRRRGLSCKKKGGATTSRVNSGSSGAPLTPDRLPNPRRAKDANNNDGADVSGALVATAQQEESDGHIAASTAFVAPIAMAAEDIPSTSSLFGVDAGFLATQQRRLRRVLATATNTSRRRGAARSRKRSGDAAEKEVGPNAKSAEASLSPAAVAKAERRIPPLLRLLRLLLDVGGADPNAEDDLGLRPLHYACYYTNPAAARLLLEEGALMGAKSDVRRWEWRVDGDEGKYQLSTNDDGVSTGSSSRQINERVESEAAEGGPRAWAGPPPPPFAGRYPIDLVHPTDKGAMVALMVEYAFRPEQQLQQQPRM